MNNEKNHIDDLFREKLSDYSLEAPEHVWKNIQAQRTPLYRAINYFKNRRGAVAGTMLLLITAATLAYYNQSTPAPQQFTALGSDTEKTVTVATPVNTPSITETNTIIAETPVHTHAVSASHGAATPGHNAQTPATGATTAASGNGEVANNGGDNTTTATQTPTNTTSPENTTATNGEETAETIIIPVTDNNNTPQLREGDAVFTQAGEPVENIQTGDGAGETDGIEGTNKTQGSTIKPEKTCRFNISGDIYSSLDFAGRALSANGAPADYLEAKKGAESFRPGYTVGLRLNADICSNTKLRLGLQYTRLHEKLDYKGTQDYTYTKTTIVYIYDINGLPIGTTTQTDTINATRDITARASNTYSFVDVPVQLEWSFYKTQKISLFATGGAAVNLRFTQNGSQLTRTLDGAQDINTANPYKPTAGFSLLGGVGMEYKCTPESKYSLLVEGNYRHGLGNVLNSASGMNQNYRILSGTVGLRYRF